MLACLQLVRLLTYDMKIVLKLEIFVLLYIWTIVCCTREVSVEGPQGCGIMTTTGAKASVQYVLMHPVVQLFCAHFELQIVCMVCHF